MISILVANQSTPTKHCGTSLRLPDSALPSKSITKKKSMISGTFDSLRSRFARPDPDEVALDAELSLLFAKSAKSRNPLHDEFPRTPKKTPKTPQKLLTSLKRPFTTFRRTKSVSKQETYSGESGNGGQGRIEVTQHMKRHKSVGDMKDMIFSTFGRKQRQPLYEYKAVSIISPNIPTIEATGNVKPTAIINPIGSVQTTANTGSTTDIESTATIESTSDVKSTASARSFDKVSRTEIEIRRSKIKTKVSDEPLQPPTITIRIPKTKSSKIPSLPRPESWPNAGRRFPGQTLYTTDSGDIFSDCRGSQQEDSKIYRCPAINFEENAWVARILRQKPRECTLWLCKQLSEEDGIWPSSAAYFHELFNATGDESDRRVYEKDWEPFVNGINSPDRSLRSPDEYLREKHRRRVQAFNLCEGLGNATKTNQFLELTSPVLISKRMAGVVDPPKRTTDMVRRLDFDDFVMGDYDDNDILEGEPTEELTEQDVIDIIALHESKGTEEYAESMKRSEAENDEFPRELAGDLENCKGREMVSDDESFYYDPQRPCEVFMAEMQAEYQERAFKLREKSTEVCLAKKLRQEAADKRHEPMYEDEEHARRSRALMAAELEEFIREAEAEENDPEWEDILAIRRAAEKSWNGRQTRASSGLETFKNTEQLHSVGERGCNDNAQGPAARKQSPSNRKGDDFILDKGLFIDPKKFVSLDEVPTSCSCEAESSSRDENASLVTPEPFPDFHESISDEGSFECHINTPSDTSSAGHADSLSRSVSPIFGPVARGGDLNSIRSHWSLRSNCSSLDEYDGDESSGSGVEEVETGLAEDFRSNVMTHRVYSADLTAVSSTTSGAGSSHSS